MGNHVANMSHLKISLNETSKDEHFKDVYAVDKLNFESVVRVSKPQVIKCLKKYVLNSEGTQHYLKLIYNILSAIRDDSLSVENRLYYLWYFFFFLRLWRAWLSKEKSYSVDNNFITLNSYVSIELNAHSLYNIILQCLNNNSFSDFFL